MTPCERIREALAAHIYADTSAGEERELQTHLGECAGCREELRALQLVALKLRPEVMFPDESLIDWDAFARSTVQRATGSRPHRAGESRFSIRSWWREVVRAPGLAAAAAGLLLLIGAGLGTYGVLSLRTPEPAPAPVQEGVAAAPPTEMILPVAMLANMERSSARNGTRRYLSESRALLMSLIASPIRCEKGAIDIKDERAKALDLIRRQRLIADELQTLPLSRAKDICRDLENLFIEVASLNDCAKAEQIAELRRLVESRQLLLRLNLVDDQLTKGARSDV